MSSTIEFPKLSPAKPYEGVAQHQSIIAAVRKLVNAGLLVTSKDRFSRLPAVYVSGRGRFRHEPSGRYCDAAEISWRPSKRGDAPDDTVTFDQVIDWLRDAGWTVVEGVHSGYFNVYGPGMSEWVERAQVRDREASERREVRAREQAAERDEIVALLEAAGVTGVSPSSVPHEAVTVKLTLAQVRALAGKDTV